jgi:glycogen synthase
MFGWEFPPNNRGGLGTACEGLTKGLNKQGADIIFNLIIADNLYINSKRIQFKTIDSPLTAYMTPEEYNSCSQDVLCSKDKGSNADIYGRDLFDEVRRFAEKAKVIARFEDYDVIHAHDWMCYPAGIEASKISNKPLVVHVHATEFDRSGGHPNPYVYQIEAQGLKAANKIIAVSNYTKNMIVNNYGIDPKKVEVVYNSIEYNDKPKPSRFGDSDQVVLFLGRITLQKGPDYFIETANKVLKYKPNVKFVMAGIGDMYPKMVEKAAALGIGNKVLFTGHLSGRDVERAYEIADLYVMPSVSEPFGLTPLESIMNNTPVIISKQSGVSEILCNALKVDFWDTDEMTNKILGVLNYAPLKNTLLVNSKDEISSFTWDESAQKCMGIYNQVLCS